MPAVSLGLGMGPGTQGVLGARVFRGRVTCEGDEVSAGEGRTAT